MSEAERLAIESKYPHLDFSPDKLLERAKEGCFDCQALVNKKCSIYIDRPLVCRLYGVVKKMRCEHGCKTARWLGEKKARELIKSMDEIDE